GAGVDGGLRDVGAVEALGGSGEAEVGEFAAEASGEERVRFIEDCAGVGRSVVPRFAHADGLRPLAGAEEDEGRIHGAIVRGAPRGVKLFSRSSWADWRVAESHARG